MAQLNRENLFLLEFLIDELNLDQKCNCTSPGEVCVSFQFLDNEELDVCEGDFNGDNRFGESKTKTGKSCLFSLTPAQAQNALRSFDITVNVFKKMPPGWQPEKSCVGTAQVPILQLFMDLVRGGEGPSPAKVLQETHNVIDSNRSKVGTVSVYVRLSCYGKVIITQFQMNMDDKSVLFKDKDGHSLYRYKKSRKGKTTKIEDVSGRPPEEAYPGYPQQGFDQMNQMMNQQAFQPQMNQFPPPNFNCPTQPCFPPNMGSNFPGNPNQMQSNYPPPNPNCPMQPCFPPEYGQGRGGRGGGCSGGCGRG